jgi:group I intron endonuclease
MIVYKYTNKIDGKIYIGITKRSFKYRHAEHKKNAGDGTYFHNAIKKHGIENFEYEVIETVNTLEELAIREQYWIKEYNAFAYWDDSKGYNETFGGDGVSGNFGELNSQFGISPRNRMTSDNYSKWRKNLKKSAKSGIENKCYGMSSKEIFGVDGWEKAREISRKRWAGDNNPNRKNPKFGKDHCNYGKKFNDEVRFKMSDGKKNKKLSPAMAMEIRNQYIPGKTSQQSLASEYGISRQTIGDVINNRIYVNFSHYKEVLNG